MSEGGIGCVHVLDAVDDARHPSDATLRHADLDVGEARGNSGVQPVDGVGERRRREEVPDHEWRCVR